MPPNQISQASRMLATGMRGNATGSIQEHATVSTNSITGHTRRSTLTSSTRQVEGSVRNVPHSFAIRRMHQQEAGVAIGP